MRYQGQTDIPLNLEGKRQANLIAQRRDFEKITLIYSSDLKRAVQTAEVIKEVLRVPIIKDRNLREINYGIWEGLYLEEVQKRYGELLKKWQDIPLNTIIPKAESLREFKRRCEKFYQRILQDNKGKNLLIISHGGPIRVIIGYALKLPVFALRSLRIDNASLSILEYDKDYKRATLVLLNDTCHLFFPK